MQFQRIWKSKQTAITIYAVMAVVLFNFSYNAYSNWQTHYITEMYDPIMTLTLSDWTPAGYFFMLFYPILLVLPTAVSFQADRESGVVLYLLSKSSRRNYWFSKLLSVFAVTFCIFTVPFLIELFLQCICFDMRSNGEPSGFTFFQTVESLKAWPLGTLFIYNRVLYAALFITIFGIISAIMACFNFSLSTLPIFKYKIFSFFPIYALLYIIALYDNFQSEYAYNFMTAFKIFPAKNVNYPAWLIIFGFMILFTLIFLEGQIRKDEL